jgi:hypothetical protein
MLAIVKFMAVLATALFAGAAVYITFVEHPTRLGCSTEIAATVWAPSYKRATVMQASLACIGFLSGLAAWLLGAGLRGSSRPSSYLQSCRLLLSSSPPPTISCLPQGVI